MINKYLSILNTLETKEQEFFNAKKNLNEQLLKEGLTTAESLITDEIKAKGDIQNQLSILVNNLDRMKDEIQTQIDSLRNTVASTYIIPAKKEVELSSFTKSGLRKGDTFDELDIQDAVTRESLCILRLGSPFYSVECAVRPGRLDWFCKIASYLITQFAIHRNQDPTLFKQIERTPEGITVITNKGEVWKYDNLQDFLPLQANKIWINSTREHEGIPQYIRVNSAFIDIWYEFITTSLQKGRAGIVSYVRLPNLIAYFITRAQDGLVRLDVLTKLLEEIFTDDISSKYNLTPDGTQRITKKSDIEKIVRNYWEAGPQIAQSHGLEFGHTPYYSVFLRRYRNNFLMIQEERGRQINNPFSL